MATSREREYDRMRKLSKAELYRIKATTALSDWQHQYADVELRRREIRWTGWRGWLAIVISVGSLVVSILAYRASITN
jgi:hypothetical protein